MLPEPIDFCRRKAAERSVGLSEHRRQYPGQHIGAARRQAGEVAEAMRELCKLAPEGGAYFAESGFFEARWQEAYWGANYPKLRAIKQKYDPDGLFFVHHGVGSEAWSADGFTRSDG